MTLSPTALFASLRNRFRSRKLFWCVVVLPSVLGVIYFGFIAPDVYLSESHIVVRDQSHQSLSGLGGLLQSTGISSSTDSDVYSVQDYLNSRDALERLETTFHVNANTSHALIPGLDRWTTFTGNRNFEDLLRYYRHHIVETEFDTSSSILTLIVRAPSAEQAYRLDEALLEMSEEFVNKMNERSHTDLLKFSLADVADAESQAIKATQAVSDYRNGESVFDPEKQSGLKLEQVGQLQAQLIATQQQMADVRAVAPSSPQIPVLQNRMRVLSQAIAAETAKVAGGEKSLSTKSAEYESLMLYRDFAAKRLELAQASLQAARENALKQQIYVERVNEPNKPDAAIEPRRLLAIVATILLSLILFGVLSLINGAVRDHVE